MIKYLLILLQTVSSLSCYHREHEKDKKILDFGVFTIKVPSSWKKAEIKGIDSYVGKILIDSSDQLFFDLGWYSNKLNEYDSLKIKDSTFYFSINDTSSTLKVVNRENLYKIQTSNIFWDSIAGYKAKNSYPYKTRIRNLRYLY